MPIGMLIDTTKCVLCRSCEVECHKFYGLKDTRTKDSSGNPELDANHYVVLQVKEVQSPDRTRIIGVSKRCFHCLNPACASVCPVGALHKEANGAVVWDENRCIGCRYCQNACPFDIPKFEWDEPWPLISKCIFCYDKRLLSGQNPVCADVCPTQAIRFGERDDMITLARERFQRNPGKYYEHIYGEQEVGGTSVMYIGAVEPEKLGLKEVEKEEYPEYTWEFLSKIPIEIAALAIILGSVFLFRHSRMNKRDVSETDE